MTAAGCYGCVCVRGRPAQHDPEQEVGQGGLTPPQLMLDNMGPQCGDHINAEVTRLTSGDQTNTVVTRLMLW